MFHSKVKEIETYRATLEKASPVKGLAGPPEVTSQTDKFASLVIRWRSVKPPNGYFT
jgi:hypothetical protein